MSAEVVDDAQVGRNITRFRGTRSQKDLADAMRSAGHKWSQATVWAVEKGDRPLRLLEAKDVMRILGMHTWDLMQPDEGAIVKIAIHELNVATGELRDAAEAYIRAQDRLASYADIYFDAQAARGDDALFVMEASDIEPWLEQSAEGEVTDVREEMRASAAAQRDVDNRGMTEEQLAAMKEVPTRPRGRFEQILRQSEEASRG
ncbi:hypothetical protein [Curtobacterium sp. MCSS17_007]|uniref:hypothetical protein n=1 Tax=Curtobacterium sp. MCSS17_007 TaxID=2175646 RepID=UPI000DA8E3EA|nr:hypothetical protein [Curtobacterium sp. MCSS17_007]WIE76394.1 hypothetical protein DEJ22_003770 [Curtobacterium sp. MCSS17_007]